MMNEKVKWMNWKKAVILCVVILFILLSIYVISFLQNIEKSKLVDFETTEKLIFQLTDITSIDKAYQFQDEQGYHIVYGKDAKENLIVFVPIQEKTSKDDLVIISADSVQTKDQIEKKWATECTTCTLTSSSPAMINKKALWELAYTDQSNRYVIEYVSMETGSTYEKMRLFRKYN